MRAENYIIKGTFFRFKPKDQDYKEALTDLQFIIRSYFESSNYVYSGPTSFGLKYFEQDFYFSKKKFKISKIKKMFGRSEEDQAAKQHYKYLRGTREEIPAIIKIYIYPGKKDDSEGFYIDIVVNPVKYLRIVQLNESPDIDESKYSFIVNENTQFLEGFAKANLCLIIQTPSPLNLFVKTEISSKLKKYGFHKIGELLGKSREKLELAKDTESIDDLLGVIENFLVDIIKRLGEKPKELHQPEKNIQLLKDKGYINSEMQGVIQGILYNNIYKTLKKPAHEREHIDLFDLRYLLDITERSIDYLLDKSWKHKIKS